MTRIDEIRERCEKATPAPWELSECVSDPSSDISVSIFHHVKGNEYIKIGDWWGSDPNDGKDAANHAFIAHSREDIPYLLGLVERMAGLIEKAQFVGGDVDYCPWCFHGEPKHKPTCPAAAILKEIGK